MSQERIQKILARAGIASRRKAEELITLGLVTVNGKIATIGAKAEWGTDSIKVNGKLLHTMEAPVYMAFHKPKGVISMTADPEGRATLADFLQKVDARVFPIGRLDFNSEGLILLTNDGQFTQDLQQKDNIPRVYHVKVKGHPNREELSRLERGMKVGRRYIKPHSIRLIEDLNNKAFIEIVLLDSGAIDLKAYVESKGFLTERIIRTSIGHITLHGLEPGEFRYLKKSQVEALLEQPELGMRRLEEEQSKAKPVRRLREEDEAAAQGEDSVKIVRGPGGMKPPRRKIIGAGASARGDAGASEGYARKSSGPAIRPLDEPSGHRPPERSFEDRGERSERPSRGGFGRGPRRDDSSFGDRPSRGGFGRKPFGDRPDRAPRGDRPFNSDRPRRTFGDRPSRDDKPFGERPSRGGFGRKPFGDRPDRAPRGDRPFGEKKFGAKRSFGDRPFAKEGGERSFGDRPSRGGFGRKPFGDRPDRAPRGDRPFGDRPARAPRDGDGEKRGGFGAKRSFGPKRSFGSKSGPGSRGGFGSKPGFRKGPRS